MFDQAVAARERLIRAIDGRRDLNAQLTGELQVAHQNLQSSVNALAARTETAVPALLPLRPFRGVLDWPAPGRVAVRFGAQHGAIGRVVVSKGIEIAAAEGQPVRAIHEGSVAFADTFAGFGNLVILHHGRESYSLYGYLAGLAVQRGAELERHAVVGTVGRAPISGPALYFELRIDATPVDPVQWLKKSGR